MSEPEHEQPAHAQVGCAVITVSNGQDAASEQAGQLVRQLLETAGHQVVHHAVVRNAHQQIKGEIALLTERRACQAILLTGGTDISSRSGTYETISGMLERRLDGFGELFRFLSYQACGPRAMVSRAVAGTLRGRLVACLPGTPDAVQLAMEKLLLPELSHLVQLISPHR